MRDWRCCALAAVIRQRQSIAVCRTDALLVPTLRRKESHYVDVIVCWCLGVCFSVASRIASRQWAMMKRYCDGMPPDTLSFRSTRMRETTG